MLRLALCCGFVLALVSPTVADDKKEPKKELPKQLVPFQGTWKVVKAQLGGKDEKDIPVDLRFTFAGDKLIVKEGKREPDAGAFSVDPKKEPAEIDLTSPKGDKIPGIFKFDKDGKLTLCIVRGKDAGRPKSFDAPEAMLMTLEKVKE